MCPFGGQRYGLLYGGMVGEEIANTSVEDLDVAGAVKVSIRSAEQSLRALSTASISTAIGGTCSYEVKGATRLPLQGQR